jgi:dolichyl-phosphate beta-glucosyltransferase
MPAKRQIVSLHSPLKADTAVSEVTDRTQVKKELFVSIVLPAYQLGNEIQRTLLTVKDWAENLFAQYEIILVDDGSKDGTLDSALKVVDSKIRVLRNRVNVGKGYSVKRGFQAAKGDYVIMYDADMEANPVQTGLILEALRTSDVVVASKRHPQASYSAPLSRKILSTGFNALVKLFTGIKLSDTQTGLKAFKGMELKKMIDLLTVKRYAFDVEVLVIAKLLNLRVTEVPARVELTKRFNVNSALLMLLDLAGIIYRLRVLKWYQRNLGKTTPLYKPLLNL